MAQESVGFAQTAFSDALQVSVLAGDPAGRAAALVGQARLALMQHDPNRARDLAQAVDTESAEGADAETHVQRELVLAEAEAALDNPAVAETHFQAALEGAKDITNPHLLGTVAFAYSQALRAWGRLAEAYALLDTAIPQARFVGSAS